MRKKKVIKPLNVVSLGAGKQSTFLLLEALSGRFGIIPDHAVFADLGTEPSWVYDNLQRLSQFCLSTYNFKIDIISKGSLDKAILNFVEGKTNTDNAPPFFLSAGGMLQRHCTSNYKIRPIRRYLNSIRNYQPVNLWIGISLDEMERMKKSQVAYIDHIYPLVRNQIYLSEIISYFEKSTFPIPGKSACYFCPFRSDRQWAIIKRNFPTEFSRAVAFDDAIRIFPGLTSKAYVHRQLIPLNQVDFEQSASLFPELLEECEGLCGL